MLGPLALALSVAFGAPAAPTAQAADSVPEVRSRLAATAERLHHAEELEADLKDDLETLQRKIDAAEAERAVVSERVAAYARSAYKVGRDVDPILSLLLGEQSGNALSKMALLDRSGRQARATMARADALHHQLRVSRAAVTASQQKLAAAQATLAGESAQLSTLFQVVSQREAASEASLVAQAARLRSARKASERDALVRKRLDERRRATRAVRSTGNGGADPDPGAGDSSPGDSNSSDGNPDDSQSQEPDAGQAPDSGDASGSGRACAVGPANTFRDTWGDRRSGGRRHKGTDLFAPYGSPVYAVVSGVVAGLRSGGLGGKSIILQGDNGDSYYYAHESAIDVSAGERVQAGELIGRVGSTGNAAGGASHVHFERWPGGGRPVNPYDFLRRMCG